MLLPTDPGLPPHRSIWSWILYDLANTLFSFIVLSFYFAPWLTQDLGARDSAVTITQSASMVVVLIAAPILGAMTDRTRRMPFLIVSTLVAIVATAALGLGGFLHLTDANTIRIAVVTFAIANVGFQLGLVFYDALLPSVSTPSTVGRIGALGVGLGYMGSFVGLGLGATILANDETAEPWLFVLTALFFLLLALPLFIFVKEKRGMPAGTSLLKDAVRQVAATLRLLPKNKDLSRFLIARVLYADAINTFILVMGIYAVAEVGFRTNEVSYTLMLALAIVFAVLGAPIWGRMVDTLGPRWTLDIVLVLWFIDLTIVVLHPVLGWHRDVFFAVGVLSGLALGGTWSADRPLMLQLAPPEKVGEYYGLYAMAGRFGAITGPLVWALVVDGLDWGRPAAVTVLFLFLLAAFVVLGGLKNPKDPRGANRFGAGSTSPPQTSPRSGT